MGIWLPLFGETLVSPLRCYPSGGVCVSAAQLLNQAEQRRTDPFYTGTHRCRLTRKGRALTGAGEQCAHFTLHFQRIKVIMASNQRCL